MNADSEGRPQDADIAGRMARGIARRFARTCAKNGSGSAETLASFLRTHPEYAGKHDAEGVLIAEFGYERSRTEKRVALAMASDNQDHMLAAGEAWEALEELTGIARQYVAECREGRHNPELIVASRNLSERIGELCDKARDIFAGCTARGIKVSKPDAQEAKRVASGIVHRLGILASNGWERGVKRLAMQSAAEVAAGSLCLGDAEIPDVRARLRALW